MSPVIVSSSSFRVLSWQTGVSHLAVHSHINDRFHSFHPLPNSVSPFKLRPFLVPHAFTPWAALLVIQPLHFCQDPAAIFDWAPSTSEETL